MSISVVQPGARLHYAAPAAFARAGLLRSLYTDLHAEHAWMRLADKMLPKWAKPKAMRRLFGRRLPPGLPKHLVKDRPAETIARAVFAVGGIGNGPQGASANLLKTLERASLGPRDVVYTALINEDVEVMERLKSRGIRVIHECIISPDVGLLLAEEFRRHGLTDGMPDLAEVEQGRRRDVKKFALADLILVPSRFTANAVETLAPDGAEIAIVPYGFNLSPFSGPANPEPGRVLAVGSVGLVKGHPDLASAARQLADGNITVRVIGPSVTKLVESPIMKGPVYLGQIPRTDIASEYAKADVLALPTICDSFGIVLVEALAMGIPVVTTPNCGDIVRDGVDGLIVPPRKPEALASAISRIVSDRDLRARMSQNARARANYFSQEAYEQRLLTAVSPLIGY